MATASIFDFLDAIETGLETYFAANSLADVSIYTTPETFTAGPNADILVLGWTVESDQEYSTMDSRLEKYSVPGMVFVSRPTNSEAGSKTARERVQAILTGLENYLRANEQVTSTVLNAHVTGININQGLYGTDRPSGRSCSCEFTVSVQNVI